MSKAISRSIHTHSTHTICFDTRGARSPVACYVMVDRDFAHRAYRPTDRQLSIPPAPLIRDGVGAAQCLRMKTWFL